MTNRETNTQLGDRRRDATKIVPINQISVAIFSYREHQLGRICSRHVDEHRADTAQVRIAVIEIEPICRRPIVGRLTGASRAGLQPNNSFATHPITAGVESVAGDDKHVGAVAGNAAMPPNSAADRCRRPSHHASRQVVYLHAHHPAVIAAAVAEISGVRHVHAPVHKSERASVFLRQQNEEIPLYMAVAFTSTGQPALVAPVSTFRE